jgi:hypothetical protein
MLIQLLGTEQENSLSYESSPTLHKYQEQFERVKRWYSRFEKIDKGQLHNVPSDYYQDEVYAFFLNCYHLKDWIKNDPSVGPVAAEVEDFINNTRELRLCADICNSHKHLRLNRSQRSGENPQFGKRHFSLHVGNAIETSLSVKYSIETSSESIDAFVLATKCLQAWQSFITINLV